MVITKLPIIAIFIINANLVLMLFCDVFPGVNIKDFIDGRWDMLGANKQKFITSLNLMYSGWTVYTTLIM